MKKFILSLSVLLSFYIVNAQYYDVIYLKNGNKLRGKIIELKPDDYVKFKTYDGNLWVFRFQELEKFDMEKTSEFKFKADTLRMNYLQCDMGFMVGTVANEMKAPLSFITTYNVQLSNNLYFGLGTGLEFYQMTYIPLLADIRIAPYFSNVSVYFQGGITFPMNEKGDIEQIEYKFKRGYLINPGISYTFRNSNDAEFIISIGYRYQKTDAQRIESEDYYPYYNDYTLITKLNRFVIRLGYRFK